MKKLLTGVCATALLTSGLVAGLAAPASAHTPEVSATCDALTVDLANYADIVPAVPATPAVEGTPGSPAATHVEYRYSHTVETDWVLYVPAEGGPYTQVDYRVVVDKEAVPAVEEVSHTEYEFKQFWNGKTKWQLSPNWNAEGNDHSLGWFFDGIERTVVDVEGVPAVEAATHVEYRYASTETTDWVLYVPEGGGYTQVDYRVVTDKAAVPAEPGVAGSDAVPAKMNTVTVTIDGNVVDDQTFGTEFSAEYPFADNTSAHDYTVEVVSWDGLGSFTETGTSTACTVDDGYTAPVLDCEPWQVPGWLNDHGDPTSCVNNEANPGDHKGDEPPATETPATETPAAPVTAPQITPAPVANVTPVEDVTATGDLESTETGELAHTGANGLGLALLALLLMGLGVTATLVNRRTADES